MLIRLNYNRATDTLSAQAWAESTAERPLAAASLRGLRRFTKRLAKRIHKRLMQSWRGRGDEIGFFGFLKKAWDSAWNKAKQIAKAIGVTKIVNAVKDGARAVLNKAGEILRDPRVAGAIGIISAAVPGIGPAIGAGYAGVRAAMSIADGIANGNPQALQVAGKYATDNSPAAAKGMALIQSVAPQVNAAASSAAENPWLSGLKNLNVI